MGRLRALEGHPGLFRDDDTSQIVNMADYKPHELEVSMFEVLGRTEFKFYGFSRIVLKSWFMSAAHLPGQDQLQQQVCIMLNDEILAVASLMSVMFHPGVLQPTPMLVNLDTRLISTAQHSVAVKVAGAPIVGVNLKAHLRCWVRYTVGGGHPQMERRLGEVKAPPAMGLEDDSSE